MDQEIESFQSQALNFDIYSMLDYDPSLPPQNGHQYLYTVMSEAARCPKTVVADLNLIKRKAKKQTFFIEEETLPKCDPDLKPSPEWETQQIADFSLLRQLISRRRYHHENPDKINLPTDEKGWLEYCIGVEKEPLLNTMMSMNQSILEKVLNYFLMWLENGKVTFTRKSTLWLFSILACLETPLIPEICSSIRSLARLCLTHRTKMENKEDELLEALNLLLCIVTKYYRQFDLSD